MVYSRPDLEACGGIGHSIPVEATVIPCRAV
jgi:hypothetical protein